MRRRHFLELASAPFLVLALPARTRELTCDVAILGGGVGGVAAALAACRNGMRVILTEETNWLGGQLTAQAVPSDEHAWIEEFGCTASYRTYRNAVRDYYRRVYPLTTEARAAVHLNPGNGSVSRLTHEPKVSVAVLNDMLAPYASSGRLVILLEHVPELAEMTGDRVRAIAVLDKRSGKTRSVEAKYFLDATELGDLLLLTRTEHVTGAEGQATTGEMHAAAETQPKVNWPQNDCWLGDLVTANAAERVKLLSRAKQLSLSLLYRMQTAAPRPDGGEGWKGLQLRADVTETEDGLAKTAYAREARRIHSEFTILEQHVGTEMRTQALGKTGGEVTAEPFADTVGVGSYRIVFASLG